MAYVIDFATHYWSESYPDGPGLTYVESLAFLLAQPYIKRVWYKSDMADGVSPFWMDDVCKRRAAFQNVGHRV